MEHCAHLQLDARPRAPLRLPLPAQHSLQLRGTCPRPTTSTTHCTAASRKTRAPGARPRCTSPCRQTEWRSCTSGRGAGPAQPDGRNGGRVRPGGAAGQALLGDPAAPILQLSDKTYFLDLEGHWVGGQHPEHAVQELRGAGAAGLCGACKLCRRCAATVTARRR